MTSERRVRIPPPVENARRRDPKTFLEMHGRFGEVGAALSFIVKRATRSEILIENCASTVAPESPTRDTRGTVRESECESENTTPALLSLLSAVIRISAHKRIARERAHARFYVYVSRGFRAYGYLFVYFDVNATDSDDRKEIEREREGSSSLTVTSLRAEPRRLRVRFGDSSVPPERYISSRRAAKNAFDVSSRVFERAISRDVRVEAFPTEKR